MKRILSLILVLVMISSCFLLTACNKVDEDQGKAPEMDANGLKVNTVVDNNGPINPLTGESVDEADANSAVRPYCVMINNHSDARPCKGLSNASIVYEALVEGSITRMMAVFTSIDDIDIGYIRSARPYYVSLVQAYDAIYVHCGYSEQAKSDIENYGIDDIDAVEGAGGNAWVRDPDRVGRVNYEHTLYAKGNSLVAYANKVGYEAEHDSSYDNTYGLTFSYEASNQCTKAATDFTVYYYGSAKNTYNTCTSFKYDAEKKCYNAFIKGVEYTDGADTSIDFANVIVLNVATKTVDNKGHQEMNLVGSGTGFFITGGKYVEIKWSRADRNDNFHYTLTDGTALALGVGKTFISIAPLDSTDGVVWTA